VEIAAAASDDAEGPLAQLGAAPDVTPEAVALGVILRNLLSQAAATADQPVMMSRAPSPSTPGEVTKA
jgi:hypothetical protein